MKKFTVKATALAIASVCGSAAFAGAITAPATATKYAVENITNATPVTLSNIVYRLDVDRTVAQDFTVIITPPANSTFDATTCTAGAVTFGAAFNVATVATVKRATASECAWEVDIAGATVTAGATSTITFAGLKLATHQLATSGTVASIRLGLKDLGETAFIDNADFLSKDVATSGQAMSITATADTGTVTDVNFTSGGVSKPLAGFVVANDDSATVAKATFTINNNAAAVADRFKTSAGADFDFKNDGTTFTVTVSGNFQGLAAAAGSLNLLFNGNTYNATPSNGVATFAIPVADFPAAGAFGPQNAVLSFTSAATDSLGTSRTFGVSGATDTAVGADATVAGNTSWWSWSANAIQLMTPFFSTDAGTGVLTRFFFSNSGPAASYTATCTAESGKTVTAGTAGSGQLASGQTHIDAKDVCSFSSGIRGAVTFTINAPAGNVKGVYNLGFNGSASSFLPLTRPYGATNTGNASVE